MAVLNKFGQVVLTRREYNNLYNMALEYQKICNKQSLDRHNRAVNDLMARNINTVRRDNRNNILTKYL